MTVCIAGISQSGEAVVCVSDMMVSMNDLSMSADAVAMKMQMIGQRWNCMMAGDVSAWPDILERARGEADDRGFDWFDLSRNQLTDIFSVAFHEVSASRAESKILIPFGLTMQNYRDEGPKLGIDVYTRILIALGESRLGLKLLVGGFNSNYGSVFSMSDDGIADHYGSVGVWAIGSGETAALGYLFNHQVNFTKDLPNLLYSLCCAKFSAEMSPGVGKKTLGCILYKDGNKKLFMDFDIDWIRKDWDGSQSLDLLPFKHAEVDKIVSKLREKSEPVTGQARLPLTPETSSGQQ